MKDGKARLSYINLCRIQGRGPGGPPTPLFSDQRPEGPKQNFHPLWKTYEQIKKGVPVLLPFTFQPTLGHPLLKLNNYSFLKLQGKGENEDNN